MIKIKDGLCVECKDGKPKPCIGKREKALCQNHYNNKLRAASGPINKVSDSKKEDDKIYAKLRVVFLADNYFCVACTDGIKRRAVHVHHTKGRGIYYLDPRTWFPICELCHTKAELNPNDAKAAGVSQDRLTPHLRKLRNVNYDNTLLLLAKLTN